MIGNQIFSIVRFCKDKKRCILFLLLSNFIPRACFKRRIEKCFCENGLRKKCYLALLLGITSISIRQGILAPLGRGGMSNQ